jgi:hypothetical protein
VFTRIASSRLLRLALVVCSAAGLIATASSTAASSTTADGKTITAAQFARQADLICAADYRQQAALGPALVNADKVTPVHLPTAAAYLGKIIAITKNQIAATARLRPTAVGMPARAAVSTAGRTILADEQAAARAARKGDLAGFKAAFNRFIVHGYPTGPDYRRFIAAATTLQQTFPFKVCGKGSNIYP